MASEEGRGKIWNGTGTSWTRFCFAQHNIELNYGDEVYITVVFDGQSNTHEIFLNREGTFYSPREDHRK